MDSPIPDILSPEQWLAKISEFYLRRKLLNAFSMKPDHNSRSGCAVTLWLEKYAELV